MTHTAAYLASLSTLILRTPTENLSLVFGDDIPLTDEIFDTLFPGVSQYRPSDTTTRLCQRIVRLIKQPKLVAGKTVYASPSAIAYASCLLIRIRCSGYQFVIDIEGLIGLSVFVAYKYLIDWTEGQRSHWARSLEMSGRRMGIVERSFLEAFQYKAWIKDDDFRRLVGRMDLLWKETLESQAMESRPAPPDFVFKKFGKY